MLSLLALNYPCLQTMVAFDSGWVWFSAASRENEDNELAGITWIYRCYKEVDVFKKAVHLKLFEAVTLIAVPRGLYGSTLSYSAPTNPNSLCNSFRFAHFLTRFEKCGKLLA